MRTPLSIRWSFGSVLFALVAGSAAIGDDPAKKPDASQQPPVVELTAQQDHQRIMDLLNIKSLRQGANGNNRQAPNAANYDETKANPYPDLPDPLVLKNGEKVTTPAMWWNQRRPEIVEDFDREIYGRVPKDTPKVKWEVTSTTNEKNGDTAVVVKKLVGHVDNSSYPAITVDIQLTLTTPANATGPVPVMMEFGFAGFGPTTRRRGPGESRRRSGGEERRRRGSSSEAGDEESRRVRRVRRDAVATTSAGEGLGLCHDHALQRSGRQRRGPDARNHRPVQQGPTAQTRRLGSLAGLGLGRFPRLGLF